MRQNEVKQNVFQARRRNDDDRRAAASRGRRRRRLQGTEVRRGDASSGRRRQRRQVGVWRRWSGLPGSREGGARPGEEAGDWLRPWWVQPLPEFFGNKCRCLLNVIPVMFLVTEMDVMKKSLSCCSSVDLIHPIYASATFCFGFFTCRKGSRPALFEVAWEQHQLLVWTRLGEHLLLVSSAHFLVISRTVFPKYGDFQ